MDTKMKDFKIIPLPKEKWEGTIIPMRYTTEEYYDVSMEKEYDGFVFGIHKRKADAPITPVSYTHKTLPTILLE